MKIEQNIIEGLRNNLKTSVLKLKNGSRLGLGTAPSPIRLIVSCMFVDSSFRFAFHQWGVWCVRHPFLILIPALLLSVAFSVGVYWIKVTTNPVELWSAKGSAGRDEKDFYDSKFTPFYRTEQLIIVPHNQTPVEQVEGNSTLRWGPVFRLEFLKVCALNSYLGNEGAPGMRRLKRVLLPPPLG